MKKLGLIILPLIIAACSNSGAADETVVTNDVEADGLETGNIELQTQAVLIDNVDAKNAADFIAAHPAAVVIDVRTPDEFADGHVADAINVDYRAEDFRGQLAALDKNTHYVLHCKSGNRSGKSLEIMKELGFNRVTHMDGGFDAWKAAGLAVAQ